MAPKPNTTQDSGSESDSESDAPEAISLSQSKKTIKKLDSSREDAIKSGRQSQRLRNQQRDKALKERSERNKEVVNEKVKAKAKGKAKSKGKGKEKEEEEEEEQLDDEEVDSDVSEEEEGDEKMEDGDPNGLEARMLRAMKEAQDEEFGSDEEDEEEEDGSEGVHMEDESEEEDEHSDAQSPENDDSDDEEDEDDSNPENDEEDEEEEEEEQEEEEEEALPLPKAQKTKFNPDHLPDEIFKAAFASQSNKKRTFNDTDADTPKTTRPSKKRKSSTKSKTPKDLVVGSRAIRVLPTSSHPQTPSTMPSRKVKKFVDRTLALKGGKQRGKGWERRPVNIGVLRRAGGPAANFVRNQS